MSNAKMNRKEKTVTFLKLVSAGQVDEAYERYIHPDFIHHNPYFKGDRETLLKGMKDNALEFPGKTYEIIHTLEDGDYVAVHGKVGLSEDLTYSVIHLFCFEGEQIIESWEASQEVHKDSPNEHGQF